MIRAEQKAIASRLAGLECDYAEHRLVLETLAEADPKRKCYRVTGGVLVQMTIQDMLPTISTNRDLLSQVLTKNYFEIIFMSCVFILLRTKRVLIFVESVCENCSKIIITMGIT